MGYIIMLLAAGAAVLLIAGYYRMSERRLLKSLEEMFEEAQKGNFRSKGIDETEFSAVENALNRFLEDSCLAEENLSEQKEKIQTLISDISHQTVTPISNILLYSQLLEEELRGSEAGKWAGAVGEQTEKLRFLIDSLIKTSRLETGIITTVPVPQNPETMLRKVAQQMENKAAQKEIQIEVSVPENCVTAVFDEKWTVEALVNIVDNAVKYTKHCGKVTITLIPYQIYCRIDIADTGIGIRQEELNQIFERFYRSGEVRDQEGVGLGLYLARQIISAQKGYIKVISQKEKGTCFSVFLPIKVSEL